MMLRFIGTAVASGLIRSTISFMVPVISRLPYRTLLQIAFWRPISGTSGALTSPLSLGAVRTALTLIPGVTAQFVQSHTVAFTAIVRLVVWVWLGVTTLTTGSMLSLLAPLTVTLLGYTAANLAVIKPLCIWLSSHLIPLIPDYSWSFFSTVASTIVSVLSHTSESALPVVKETSWWLGILVVSTEILNNWVAPYISWDLAQIMISTGAGLIAPYLPSSLIPFFASFFGGLLILITSPFHLMNEILPWLHSWLAYIPYSSWVWS